MSQPSRLRRPAVALALAAAAVASIATSPAPTLGGGPGVPLPSVTLTAEQPTATQRLQARLELDKGIEGRDANASLRIEPRAHHVVATQEGDAGVPDAGVPDAGEPDAGVPDAGGADAGGSPLAPPVVELVVRDAANPSVELYRGISNASLELMRSCAERVCEQTFILEWSLAEGSPLPVEASLFAFIQTELDPDDGRAMLDLVP